MGKKITVNGQNYDITNWDEFSEKILAGIGFQTINEMRLLGDRMNLMDTSEYRLGWHSEVQDKGLILTNTAPHAIHLEYGTYEYKDTKSFPKRTSLKKKNMSRAAAKKLPKGMQPFAVMRRVLWNKKKMEKVINNAVRAKFRSE